MIWVKCSVNSKLSLCHPHHPYDCAIDLLPRGPLPSSRLYNLSCPERESMEKYIHDSLASGIIRPSSSTVSAGFFFMGKKDKTFRPCIDFRRLKYPLPLSSSAFIFSKLDLRNAYHLVKIREGKQPLTPTPCHTFRSDQRPPRFSQLVCFLSTLTTS